jgi:hypothetical protein
VAIDVTRYVGTCQVCAHPKAKVRKITGMIESRNTRVDILSAFPELNHRALNKHILRCLLQREAQPSEGQGE